MVSSAAAEEKPEDEQGTGPLVSAESAAEDPGGPLWRICELSGCVFLLALALVVEFNHMPQHMRQIPVQVIDGQDAGGSALGSIYVRNLLFDQEETEATVGTVGLVLIGLVAPLLLQLTAATVCSARRRPYDRYNTLCSYILAVAITFLVINAVKLYCGYLRPHFYAVCQPDDADRVCTNDDAQENREVRDSFPSGHAGLALAGLGSLSLYVHRRCGAGGTPARLANARAHRVARLWSLLAAVPVLVALFVGASRVHDDYHHPADIVGGFMVGGVAAYFCHHTWFLV